MMTGTADVKPTHILYTMKKVYVMSTCPDCFQVKQQLEDAPGYELIDIGDHVRNLKQFLRLRDTNPAFDEVRANGNIGIPCIVDDDGSVTFSMEGIVGTGVAHGMSCSIDGTGC